MYGGIEKTPAEIENDNKLIETVTKNQTREDASREASGLGWEYFYDNDLKTAMKRFNQAWLLDSDNPHVYWGFGVLIATQARKEWAVSKIDQSIEMLEKANRLSPPNAGLLMDLGYSYTVKGLFEKKKYNRSGQKFFDKANALYNQASRTDPFELLYYNWASSLLYEGKYEEALSITEQAKKLNFKIPKELIKDIKKKIRN